MATGKKGGMTCTYVVGRYRPAGNFAAQYKKNVPKGSFNNGLCSKLDNMVKEIEENSGGKKKTGYVQMDDKFGEEKVATFSEDGEGSGTENTDLNNNYIDQSTTSDYNSGQDDTGVREGKDDGGTSKGEEKKEDLNEIHIDDKSDSNEEAEKLIDKENSKGEKDKGQHSDDKGQSSDDKGQSSVDKSESSEDTKVTLVGTDDTPGDNSDIEFKSGKPMSRNGSGKKNKHKSEGFIIKTDDEPLMNQRQLDSTSGDFEQKGLVAHDAFRKIHGTESLTLNAQMSNEAAEYAKVLAQKGTLVHSKTGGKYGENLAMGCTSKSEEMSAEEATKNW